MTAPLFQSACPYCHTDGFAGETPEVLAEVLNNHLGGCPQSLEVPAPTLPPAVVDAIATSLTSALSAQLDEMGDKTYMDLCALVGATPHAIVDTINPEVDAAWEDLAACLAAAIEQRVADWKADQG